jgi:hypothetical protein
VSSSHPAHRLRPTGAPLPHCQSWSHTAVGMLAPACVNVAMSATHSIGLGQPLRPLRTTRAPPRAGRPTSSGMAVRARRAPRRACVVRHRPSPRRTCASCSLSSAVRRRVARKHPPRSRSLSTWREGRAQAGWMGASVCRSSSPPPALPPPPGFPAVRREPDTLRKRAGRWAYAEHDAMRAYLSIDDCGRHHRFLDPQAARKWSSRGLDSRMG